ncbi:MAG: LptA/OstA family protein [Pseudomonadota bacterium]
MKTRAPERTAPRRAAALAAVAALGLTFWVPAPLAVSTHIDGFQIESVESEVDFVSGVRVYRGKVRVRHQNLRMRSEALTEFRRNGKVIRVVANGSPVRFEQLAPYSIAVHKATASRAEYRPATGELKLWNYTVQDLDGNRSSGQRGTYRFAVD